MKIAEVMTRDVEIISPHSTLQEAAALMKKLDVGPLPVCQDDRLVGVVTDRDITVRATAEGQDPWGTRVRDIMSTKVVSCFDDQEVEEAAALMRKNQVRRLLVLDRNKRLVGIVSLGDLAVESRDQKSAADALKDVSKPAEPKR